MSTTSQEPAALSSAERGKIVIRADLGRAGLANRLFCWGRAQAAAERYGLPMLAPQWVKMKIGPILRGERDKRFYLGLFRPEGYVTGPKAWWIQRRYDVIRELDFAARLQRAGDPTIVNFFDMVDFFRPIYTDAEVLRRRLWDITAPWVKEAVDAHRTHVGPVALHVRRGDMPEVAPGQVVNQKTLCQLPTGWFVNVVKSLQRAHGRDTPVSVFSDGTDEQLEPILALPNVRRVEGGSALADIWLMAHAKVIATSGPSTFGQWAVYLGGSGAVWYPGFRHPISQECDGAAVDADAEGLLDDHALATLDAHERAPLPAG
ncbi:MAG: hypothetical protein AAF328_10380 [Planctomycetota bacterium]